MQREVRNMFRIIIGLFAGLVIGIVNMRSFGIFGFIASVIAFTGLAAVDLPKAIIGGVIGLTVLIGIFGLKVIFGM